MWTACVGFAVAVAFTVFSGLQYRAAEQRGEEPGYTPDAILLGTSIGLLLLVAGVAWVAVSWAVRVASSVGKARDENYNP